MKKSLSLALLLSVAAGLTACSTSAVPEAAQPQVPAAQSITIKYQCAAGKNQKVLVDVTYQVQGDVLTSAVLDLGQGRHAELQRDPSAPNADTQNIYSNGQIQWITDSATAANVQKAGANMLQSIDGNILLKYCELAK